MANERPPTPARSLLPIAPPVPRKPTPPGPPPRPAEYSYGPDETPTRPDGIADPGLGIIISIYRQECDLDRRRLTRMVEAWHSLSLDQRVLVEQLCFELARPARG